MDHPIAQCPSCLDTAGRWLEGTFAVKPVRSIFLFVCLVANTYGTSQNAYAQVRMIPSGISAHSVIVPVVDTVTPPLIGPSLLYGVDTMTAPCLDFYQYVNGGWRNATKWDTTNKSPSKKVGMFSDTFFRIQRRLQDLLDSARVDVAITHDPTLRVLGQFYNSCMVADTLERLPFQRALSRAGQQDSTRAQQCLQRTMVHFGGALGQVFAHDVVASNATPRMQQLLDAIRKATIERLKVNSWLSTSDRAEAITRLQRLRVRVGMPKDIVDYSPLVLTTDYAANVKAIKSFNNLQWVNAIGGDVREQWMMYLFTVNASYQSGEHAIEVPAAMFVTPFFDANGEDARNFAGVGYVIGHEIFHSIALTLPALKGGPMIEQFKAVNSSLGTLDGWSADGRRTFDEDVADLGGVRVAYDAWKTTMKQGKIASTATGDGYTPDQRFFVALGQVWRSKWWGTKVSQDVHAAPFARVNSMVMHMPEFAKAFGCKEGDAMYLSPEKRAAIW